MNSRWRDGITSTGHSSMGSPEANASSVNTPNPCSGDGATYRLTGALWRDFDRCAEGDGVHQLAQVGRFQPHAALRGLGPEDARVLPAVDTRPAPPGPVGEGWPAAPAIAEAD